MRRQPTRALPSLIKTDGRHARKARTREAIVSALLALLDEGHVEPTAAEIAHRAKVAIRSIAQHFRTREELMLALAAYHASKQTPLAGQPENESFEARLAHFVASRAHALENSMTLRRAAQRVAGNSKAIARTLMDVARRRREELKAALGPELEGAEPWLSSTIEALTSGTTWDGLRHEQKLSPAAAEQVILQALRRLLRP